MHDNDTLDRLVDKALHSYIQEPPLGMEDRILLSLVATNKKQKRPQFWLWAISTPVAVAALLIVLLWPHETQKMILAPNSQAQPKISAVIPPAWPAPAGPMPPLQTNVSPNHRVHRPAPETQIEPYPKQDVFPTPLPPSAEARVLPGMLKQLSPEEQKRVAEFQQSSSEPVSIAQLKIDPIVIPSLSAVR